MLLRNEEDYYAETVKIEDAEFRICEVPDETHESYTNTIMEIQKLIGVDDLPDGPLTLDMVKDIMLAKGLKADAKTLNEVVKKQRDAMTAMCQAGIVNWSGIGKEGNAECNAANIAQVKNLAKFRLAGRIYQISTLNFTEADFTDGLPRR